MGLQKALNKMSKKRKKLLLDLTSVGIIFTMIYGFLVGTQLYFQGKGFMAFFNMGTLMPIVVLLVFLFLVRSLIQGKSIKAPNIGQSQSKKAKTSKSRPQPRQRPQKKPHITAKRKKQVRGSIKCPKCNTLIVGPVCSNCGWRR